MDLTVPDRSVDPDAELTLMQPQAQASCLPHLFFEPLYDSIRNGTRQTLNP